MTNTKKLRQAIKAGDIKQITEILREDPKGKLRLTAGSVQRYLAKLANK